MKGISVLLLLAGMGLLANGMELTSDNWDEHTLGKTVFIKFLAPWCGHCKRMKPDWDKLIEKYKGDKTALVADVDCTAAGKQLCETHGVQGYPTIKWGDPGNLEDYKGGRSYNDLEKFAEENLKPVCSPNNLDLCDEEKKAEIEKIQAMSDGDLRKAIDEKEAEIKQAEEEFSAELKKLQEKYKEMQEEKDKGIQEVKDSGLSLMKAVKAAKKKKKTEL